jgi:hypothetical protein
MSDFVLPFILYVNISVIVLAVQLVFVLFGQHVTKPELNQASL